MRYPPLKSSSNLICSLSHAKLNYPGLTTNHGSATVLFLPATICASCPTGRCLQHTLCPNHHRRIASVWREMEFTNLRFEPISPPSARDEGAAASEHQVGHIVAAAHTSKKRKTYKYPHPRFIAEPPNLTLGRCFTRIQEHGHTELNV